MCKRNDHKNFTDIRNKTIATRQFIKFLWYLLRGFDLIQISIYRVLRYSIAFLAICSMFG